MDEWSLMLGESQHEMDLIKVYPECRLQRIIGFGGAFTEASAHVFARMPEGAQERLLRAYFGSDGARYTLCRAPIMSCDFSLSPYSYHLRPLDAGLRGLDLSHDDREIIPLIRRAQALREGQPSTVARKASRRMPSASGPTRTLTRVSDMGQDLPSQASWARASSRVRRASQRQ